MAMMDKRLPPVWVRGLGFLPLGVFGSVMLLTTPTLLASNHTPEPTIALVTAAGLASSWASIPVMPILDWRWSRKTYAILMTLTGAAFLFAALRSMDQPALVALFLFLGDFAISLCVSAVGGWFGDLATPEEKGPLGAWFTVANIGGGGLTAAIAMPLIRDTPQPLGDAVLALLVMAALPLYVIMPCRPADRRLASESFRDFARDVMAMLRRREVLWALALFLAPSASFALTNTLSGFGRDFSTSEQLVGVIGGAGAALAGVLGSLIVPLLLKRIPAAPLYLLVGGVGAIFTLALAAAARTPVTFGLAMLGENVFQAAAFSSANVITLEAIGHDNPLAATQFGVLIGATVIPLTYMQVIDGHAYQWGGATGSLVADAVISGVVCVLLGFAWSRWRRPRPVAAPVNLS
jgi:PAT family beta-lactamase induction signal transducer AmpG